MNKLYLPLFIASIFVSLNIYPHEAFGLAVGQDKQNIEYNLTKKADLSVGLNNLRKEFGFKGAKYKTISCYVMFQNAIYFSYKTYRQRAHLTKEQKKIRKKAYIKSRDFNNIIYEPTDLSFGNMLELGWYSVDGRATCLVFWNSKLIGIFLDLTSHGITDSREKGIELLKEHCKDHISGCPGWGEEGHWDHDEEDWLVKLNSYNFYFDNRYGNSVMYPMRELQYTNQKKIDLIISDILGHKEL